MADGPAVSLGELLVAREGRAERQRALIAQYGRALISFTLNVAGPVKTGAMLERAFDEGLRIVCERFDPFHADIRRPATGYEALLVVDGDPLALKRRAIGIEEADELGRLFDIDVIAPGGERISREAAGHPPRGCLICGGDAHACARSRAHGLTAVVRRTDAILDGHFARACADKAAALATEALMVEVCVSPKPGLVDRFGNGAHRDMDIFTFISSAAALTPYFRTCALKGWTLAHLSPDTLFEHLREPGLRAESAMRSATGGVNTHKGAIYSLGILCAAVGRAGRLDLPSSPESLAALCGDMARPSAERELRQITPQSAVTAGQKVFASLGLRGIRGEASGGFPTVLRYGLPALRAALAAGRGLNDAAAVALLHLIAHAEDTVLIARAGPSYGRVIGALRTRLQNDPLPRMDYIDELDRAFTEQNLSPGGSADLLAVTLMLHALDDHARADNGPG